MLPHLNVDIAVSTGPTWKETPRECIMTHAYPFGCNNDLLGRGLEYFIKDLGESERQPLGKLRIRKSSLRCFKVAG